MRIKASPCNFLSQRPTPGEETEAREGPSDLGCKLTRVVFFQLHRDLDREGPGSFQSTRKAFQMIEGLPAEPRVLDIGCGPGQQTVDLLKLVPSASITAVDTHQPFLDQLKRRAPGVEALPLDMRDLPFEPHTFDLIWSEGAAYFMGSLEKALEGWKGLLKPGGWIAVSEAVWLVEDPPTEVKSFWNEYPAMLDVTGCRRAVQRQGFQLVGDFVLPDDDWWEYYRPLVARLEALEAEHPGESTLREARHEIEMRRQFAECYSYLFMVARLLP